MASLNSNARNTASEVKEIFDTDLDDSQLHNWVNMAAETTDDVESHGELSSNRLKLIEKNLAAHYAATQDPRVSEETIGDAQFDYKGTTETTDYWRTALRLDTTEFFEEDADKPRADIRVLDGRNIE